MMKIANHVITKRSKTLIIAEVGQSHLGNIKKAERIIKKISKTGVEFIKFQTHISNQESTLDEPFRKNISEFKNRMQYWKKMEFTLKQWKQLQNICKKNNLTFLSSPFSLKAVEILKKLNVPAWKIGSGEFFSKSLLDKIIEYKQPIIISTGLATLREISRLTNYLKRKKAKYILMQCTSLYPCKLKDIGINMIDVFKKNFNCYVGLSDHTGTIYPSLMAIAKGASLIEVHVGDKNDEKNPDNSSSISFSELNELSKTRDAINTMVKNVQDKKKLSPKLKKIKRIFTKSCALKEAKNEGEIIKQEDIIFKKPGTGIPENKIKLIIGKKLIKNVSSNRLLKMSDLRK